MQIRERSKRTIENAVHMRDGNAIVGHWHIPLGAVPQTILHFPLVQHTAAAVNNKRVLTHVLGKLIARGK